MYTYVHTHRRGKSERGEREKKEEGERKKGGIWAFEVSWLN